VVILDGVLGELLLNLNGGKTIVLEDVLGDLVAESSGVLDDGHSSLSNEGETSSDL
jgi:hypothetical protein